MSDIILFKALSFLTSLYKSDRGKHYKKYGFTEIELKNETIFTLKEGLEMDGVELENYQELVEKDMNGAIESLLEEGLIRKENDIYFITAKGLEMTDFMIDLSAVMTIAGKNVPDKSSVPFRNFPGSSDIYGLN